MRARRDAVLAHLRDDHELEVTLPGTATGTSSSATAKDGRSAWRLAATLVEQYSPLLLRAVMRSVHAREQRQRQLNDAALANDPQAAPASPLTYILDEQPILLPPSRAGRTRFQQQQWSVLVVIEVRWRPTEDPMTLPLRDGRLRLVRAYSRGNEQAWRLMLDELGVRPAWLDRVQECAQLRCEHLRVDAGLAAMENGTALCWARSRSS